MPSRAAMLALSALLLRAIPVAVAHPTLGGNLPSAGEFEYSNVYTELENTDTSAPWGYGQPGDVGSHKHKGGDDLCGSGGKGNGGGGSWSGTVTTKTITDW